MKYYMNALYANTYLIRSIISNPILPIVLWVTCAILLSFLPWNFSWILFPVCNLIVIYPYMKIIQHWIFEHRIIILYQIIISILYLLMHKHHILSLELWSDEIFSLKISGNAFQEIAKTALTQSVIPPYHYWELWFWKALISSSSVTQIEFLYRVPSMVYHTISAIIFASFISSKSSVNSCIWKYILNCIAFLSFYFNPLLFPFALEVRPYAAMVLGSVISLIALDSKEFKETRYVPVQLSMFNLSFFHAISWIPVGIYLSILKNKKIFVIYVISLVILYISFAPYIRMPDQTTQDVVRNAINRSIHTIVSTFISNNFSLVILLISCVYFLLTRTNYLLAVQVFSVWIFSVVLGFMIQYTAFAPRHLILSFPILIYILFFPLFSIRIRWYQILLICICTFFTLPWILKTDRMLTNRQFAPKISIGIKDAIFQAQKQDKSIALEVAPVDADDPLYFTYKYMEYVSLWYINQYNNTQLIRMNASEYCSSDDTTLYFFIGFTSFPCSEKQHSARILQFKIQE